MRKKRLLFIIEAMGGGVFTYIVDLSNEIVKTFDVFIAYAVRSQTPIDFEKYFDKRVHLIKVENFERSINPKSDIKAFFEIKAIAKKVNPDIIHLHSSKAGVLGRFAFDGNKIPIFYTPHGYSFLMKDHSSIKRFAYKTIEKICGKRKCETISCSEGEYRESLKLTKYATYVNNGINIEKLQNLLDSTVKHNENKFTVFTLGRICYQKNPMLFNQVALALPNIKFLWIGDGELRDELTAPNIKITGWVDRKEALLYSIQGNVFLLTSLWEGLPLSLLEAMYMKKLCVVSNVIGNKDVIHDGKNGFVCKKIEEYVTAIICALNVSPLCQKYIINAYEDILKDYNTKVMSNKYSEIYLDSLENRK